MDKTRMRKIHSFLQMTFNFFLPDPFEMKSNHCVCSWEDLLCFCPYSAKRKLVLWGRARWDWAHRRCCSAHIHSKWLYVGANVHRHVRLHISSVKYQYLCEKLLLWDNAVHDWSFSFKPCICFCCFTCPILAVQASTLIVLDFFLYRLNGWKCGQPSVFISCFYEINIIYLHVLFNCLFHLNSTKHHMFKTWLLERWKQQKREKKNVTFPICE